MEAIVTGVTNRIPYDEAADLLGSARACVAFVVEGRPQVEPAVVRRDGSRFLIGIAAESELASDVGEASLVIDEGVYFFDLRAIYVRGTPSPVEAPTGDGLRWIVLEPIKLTCWDYGRLRMTDERD